MNKRHYEHTLPNIRGSLSNTYKTSRFSLATCPFFPVGLLKNECGAWLKNPVSRGGSFCFFVFSRPRLTERKRSASENGSILSHGRVKKEVRADRYPSRTSGDETQGGMLWRDFPRCD